MTDVCLWAGFLLGVLGLAGVGGLTRYVRRLRRRLDELVEEKQVVFNFIYDVSEVFAESETVNLAELGQRVVAYGMRVTGARAGALYLAENDGGGVRPLAIQGVFPPLHGPLGDIAGAFSKIAYVDDLVRQRAYRPGEGLVGEVFQKGRPILIPDSSRDLRVPVFPYDFLRIESVLLVPMRFRHKVLGVLVMLNRLDGRPFDEAQERLLQALADQASVSIHYTGLGTALEEKRKLDYELGMARRIQQSLLPKTLPRIEGLDLAAFSLPARQIGGDYYDVLRLDEAHLGWVVADVSGKGVPGALVMSLCRTLLRSEAQGTHSPAAVLRAVNRSLAESLSEDMFVTILYGIYDRRGRTMRMARAGHPYPLLVPAGGQSARSIKSSGVAMGMGPVEVFDRTLNEVVVTLGVGDMLVAYTDGLIEARDRKDQEWGRLNLVQTALAVAFDGGTASAMADRIRQKLLQFTGEMPQYDDLTFLCLRVEE